MRKPVRRVPATASILNLTLNDGANTGQQHQQRDMGTEHDYRTPRSYSGCPCCGCCNSKSVYVENEVWLYDLERSVPPFERQNVRICRFVGYSAQMCQLFRVIARTCSLYSRIITITLTVSGLLKHFTLRVRHWFHGQVPCIEEDNSHAFRWFERQYQELNSEASLERQQWLDEIELNTRPRYE